MKKSLKIILIVVIVIVVFIGGFALFIEVRGIPSYKAENPDITIVSTPERVERGRILVNMLCADCHKDPATGKLTGGDMDPSHKLPFGNLYSQNITQDKTVGIGEWTDGQLIYLLRTGIKRNGKYAPPWMAKLPNMSDEDVASIISFLHSDDLLVKADPTPDRPCEPSFLTKFLCFVAFKPFPFPNHIIPQPDTTNKVAWGKYLVWNLECFSCHSQDYSKNDFLFPPNSAGYLGGGNKMPEGIYSANITPDKETGIGNWSEETFIRALRFGLKPDGTTSRLPMKPYVMLSESEADAIYQYLKTVPPIKNKVDSNIHNS